LCGFVEGFFNDCSNNWNFAVTIGSGLERIREEAMVAGYLFGGSEGNPIK
jgi:hypothetical protein